MKTIIGSVVLAMLLFGCSDEHKEEAHEMLKDAKESVVETKQEIVEETKESVAEIKQNMAEVKQDVEEETQEIVEDVKQKALEVKKDIEPQTISGEVIYKKCVACHGANGEKKALNKSKIIKDWDESKVLNALKGYKDGTYGSSMKGVMKSQVSKLSDAEMKAVSEYISKLD
jgi:cytochrome c553